MILGKKLLLSLSLLFSLAFVSCSSSQNQNENTNSLESFNSAEVFSSSSEQEEAKSEVDQIIQNPTDILEFKKVKVYLNPSVQTNNLFVSNLGSEAKNMEDIVFLMEDILKDINYIDLKINSSRLPLKDSVAESNAFKTNIHLALHSNAGGGSGSEIYTTTTSDFTSYIYSSYNKIHSFPNRGIKNGSSLYECKNVQAKHSALLETLFHDNVKEANWIVNNKQKIATNLANSIASYALEIAKN